MLYKTVIKLDIIRIFTHLILIYNKMNKMYKLRSVGFALLAFVLFAACSDNKEQTKEEEEDTPKELVINGITFPEDTNASDFTNFKKRVMMFEFVTTGCGFCPYVMAATMDLVAQPEKSDNFCVIASFTKYNSGRLNNEFSTMFEKQLSDYSVPKMYFDARKRETYSFNRNINDLAENVIYKGFVLALKEKYPAKVGITAKSAVVNDKIKVDVGLKVAQKGKYNIQIALVEDNVYTYQDNSEGIKGYDFKDHHHVLQSALVNSYEGQALNKGAELAVFSYHAESFELEFPAYVKDRNNCKLVIYVLTADSDASTKLYVTNAVTIKPNGGEIPIVYDTPK